MVCGNIARLVRALGGWLAFEKMGDQGHGDG
jgi:hypothetical protein